MFTPKLNPQANAGTHRAVASGLTGPSCATRDTRDQHQILIELMG